MRFIRNSNHHFSRISLPIIITDVHSSGSAPSDSGKSPTLSTLADTNFRDTLYECGTGAQWDGMM